MRTASSLFIAGPMMNSEGLEKGRTTYPRTSPGLVHAHPLQLHPRTDARMTHSVLWRCGTVALPPLGHVGLRFFQLGAG